MHETELMMAIIMASTALVGLTGVIICQIIDKPVKRWLKTIKTVFIFSFLFGILAVVQAIGWLASESYGERVQATIFFAMQIIIVSGASSVYWMSERAKAKK